jgi:predicted enzyme related to lactoylglutathione lyase
MAKVIGSAASSCTARMSRRLGTGTRAFWGWSPTISAASISCMAKAPRPSGTARGRSTGSSGGTDYFEPSGLPFMLNLMVDDLDGVLARVAEAGVEEVQERQDYEYGRFAWIMDPDGRKLELWEPPGAA